MEIHKIYILYTGMFCKIGVTKRKVTDRIKEIQTSCPLPISHYSELSNLSKGDAYHIENELKSHLSHHLIQGEWYKEFNGVSKSVKFKLQEIGKDFVFKHFSTHNKKFQELSVIVSNKIKKAVRERDIRTLSLLLTDMNYNKDYNHTKFLLYPKDTIMEHLENSIGIVLKLMRNENIELSDEDRIKLEKYKKPTNFKPDKDKVNKVLEKYSFLMKGKK